MGADSKNFENYFKPYTLLACRSLPHPMNDDIWFGEKSSMSDRDLYIFHLAMGRWDGLPIGLQTFNVEGNCFTNEGFGFIRRGSVDDRFVGRSLINSLDFGFIL